MQFIFIIEIKQAKGEVQTKIYSVCISQLVIMKLPAASNGEFNPRTRLNRDLERPKKLLIGSEPAGKYASPPFTPAYLHVK